MQLKLKAIGLKAPNVKVGVTSKSLDLAFLSTGKESQVQKGAEGENKSKSLDASLDEMAGTLEKSLKNPMLDRAKVDFSMALGELKLEGARIANFKVNAGLQNRQFTVTQAGFTGYGGSIGLSGSSKLIPTAPTFDYNLKLQSLDIGQVLGAHAPAWKGQLSGTLNGNTSVSGAGLHKSQIASNLKGSIKGAILKGHTSLELSKIISTLMKQLPQKPDLRGNANPEKLKGKFKTMTMDSRIIGRMISFTSLDIVFEPDEYNLGEMEMKAGGSLTFDRQIDLSGNVFLSPQVIKWPEAVGSSGKIEIPVKISGPMDNAKPDISYTISKMGTRVLKKTLEKEAKKGVENLLKSKETQNFLKGIFK